MFAIAGIVAVLAAVSALLLPRAPTTPADIELAPETIPLAAGHPLETSARGTTTLLSRPSPNVSTSGPVRRRETGLWLAPESDGVVVVTLRPRYDRGRATVAYVSASAYGPVTTTFVVRGRSGRPRYLGTASWSGLAQRLDVTPEARTGVVRLTIRTTNAAHEPALVASRIVTILERPVSWPSPLVVAFWATLCCAGALAVAFLLELPAGIAFALVGTLALGAFLRIRQLAHVASVQLVPDAAFYRYLADGMRYPDDTGAREPLWPLLDRLWFSIVGSSDVSLRILTLVLSVALIGVLYSFAARATGSRVVGIAAALLLAVHHALIDSSTLGLREELYALLLVLAAHVALLGEGWSPTTRMLALAGLVSALALLRLTALYFVPFLLLLGLRHGLRPRDGVAALACAVVLLVPYLVYSQQHFGDAFWASNIHGVYFRNFEFVLADGKTCHGCPTVPQMLASASFAGTDISTTHYIFGMHSTGTIVSRTAKGLYDLLLRPGKSLEVLVGRSIIVYLYLAGLVIALSRTRGRELLLLILLGINLVAFLEPIGLFDFRLAYHVIPFMLVIAVLPLAVVVEAIGRRRSTLPRAARSPTA